MLREKRCGPAMPFRAIRISYSRTQLSRRSCGWVQIDPKMRARCDSTILAGEQPAILESSSMGGHRAGKLPEDLEKDSDRSSVPAESLATSYYW
jgi:hypothetical protein